MKGRFAGRSWPLLFFLCSKRSLYSAELYTWQRARGATVVYLRHVVCSLVFIRLTI